MIGAEPGFATIDDVSAGYRRGDLSPVEVTEALLNRIERLDPILNAYVSLRADRVRQEAVAMERELRRGADLDPLCGIPVSVKDSIALAGERTTAGSRVLANWVPARDASCLSAVKKAGALIIGKTNLFEFAFGEAHADYGHVRNPWDLKRSTAGSSTGSVAAVAAGLCFGSVATDAGGSIRVPAAMCGVVGLKPTYGRVGCDGVVTTAWSLCHVGPVARNVRDVAHLFDALSGGRSTSHLERGVRGAKLLVAEPQAPERIDGEVAALCEEAYRVLEAEGATLRRVQVPDLLLVRTVLWAIAGAEAADVHREWLAEHREDYHPVVRARLERGAAIPASTYIRAQRVRRWLVRRLRAILDGADGLLLPVSPIPAYPLGTRRVEIDGAEEEVAQAVTRYTPLASVTGRPAVSVPCGFTASGLPVGFQIIGHPDAESDLLRIARAYERARPWHARHPEVATPDIAERV